MPQWLYDGQSEPVQAAAQAALAAARQAIGLNLTAQGSAASSLAVDLPALAALEPDDAAGYAAQLQLLLADYVAGIVADATTAAQPDPSLLPGYEDWSRLPDLPEDPSYGLAALAAIGGAIMPASPVGVVLNNWLALLQLVEGCATAALQVLYAQTAFASSSDADAAREQLFGLIVAQIEAAAGNDALVQAWRGALTAAVTDLTVRGASLPEIATLGANTALPSVYLAQLLYQDGAQGDVLVQRNGAPHPLFMPLTIEYLEAA